MEKFNRGNVVVYKPKIREKFVTKIIDMDNSKLPIIIMSGERVKVSVKTIRYATPVEVAQWRMEIEKK